MTVRLVLAMVRRGGSATVRLGFGDGEECERNEALCTGNGYFMTEMAIGVALGFFLGVLFGVLKLGTFPNAFKSAGTGHSHSFMRKSSSSTFKSTRTGSFSIREWRDLSQRF